jgi:hypothetical protein
LGRHAHRQAGGGGNRHNEKRTAQDRLKAHEGSVRLRISRFAVAYGKFKARFVLLA